jgi:hypothetical protein
MVLLKEKVNPLSNASSNVALIYTHCKSFYLCDNVAHPYIINASDKTYRSNLGLIRSEKQFHSSTTHLNIYLKLLGSLPVE